MNEKQIDRAHELANAHWSFIDNLLDAHEVDDGAREVAHFHFISAFVHGYKHALQDISLKAE